ncbi:hypothetical protein O9G_003801 [Rozella allomycis CSF55]|uniref:Uncharacterized protein n=1 Tax=Rozella allomycis (strain CSF55) TaxID=988480 RepID=A0A075AR13_ROZAC|nr:hypothetical protein O9G_003801 [Rozella allomycis CSF55]|eukprot:EPZ32673.1 hypothetical protein O9G_003801 [Rozella allomycis CSF55]
MSLDKAAWDKSRLKTYHDLSKLHAQLHENIPVDVDSKPKERVNIIPNKNKLAVSNKDHLEQERDAIVLLNFDMIESEVQKEVHYNDIKPVYRIPSPSLLTKNLEIMQEEIITRENMRQTVENNSFIKPHTFEYPASPYRNEENDIDNILCLSNCSLEGNEVVGNKDPDITNGSQKLYYVNISMEMSESVKRLIMNLDENVSVLKNMNLTNDQKNTLVRIIYKFIIKNDQHIQKITLPKLAMHEFNCISIEKVNRIIIEDWNFAEILFEYFSVVKLLAIFDSNQLFRLEEGKLAWTYEEMKLFMNNEKCGKQNLEFIDDLSQLLYYCLFPAVKRIKDKESVSLTFSIEKTKFLLSSWPKESIEDTFIINAFNTKTCIFDPDKGAIFKPTVSHPKYHESDIQVKPSSLIIYTSNILDSIGTNTVLICSNILDALKITSEVANSFKANLGDALVKKVILKDLLCDAILAYPYTQQAKQEGYVVDTFNQIHKLIEVVRVYVSNKALALNKSFDHGLEKYRAELNKKLDFITKLLVQLDIKESKKCLNFASTENLDIGELKSFFTAHHSDVISNIRTDDLSIDGTRPKVLLGIRKILKAVVFGQ